MGLLDIILGKKDYSQKFMINSIEVEIIDTWHDRSLSEIKNWLLIIIKEFLRDEKKNLHDIKYIKFKFPKTEDLKDPEAMGYYNYKEDCISFNFEKLRDREGQAVGLYRLLKHEMVHFIRDKTAKEHSLLSKLRDISVRKVEAEKNEFKKAKIMMINYLHDIFVKFLEEGLAVYNAEIDILDSKKDIYAKASASASQINIIFKIVLDNIKAKKDEADFNAYTEAYYFYNRAREKRKLHEVGLHMIYTIFKDSKREIDIREISKKNVFKIIIEYEKIIEQKFNYQKKVISFSSGKGILDYKRMLNEIKKLE